MARDSECEYLVSRGTISHYSHYILTTSFHTFDEYILTVYYPSEFFYAFL